MKKVILALCCLLSIHGFSNNMLVQNVTTTGNDPVNKTIQVQFDISWDNSWRDSINYDAAWIFIKFKDAGGLWRHAQLNQTGFNMGTGTADSIKVTSDKVGSWVYRSGLGSGTFSVTGMQLQWNYGLSGLTSVTGLEIRVFAVEMVYVPEEEFNVAPSYRIAGSVFFSLVAPNGKIPVINSRMTPSISFTSPSANLTIRIKGDTGIDSNNDGVIDNSNYPTGYKSFYVYKYELSEQQYADFLNTLSTFQVGTLGVATSTITLNNSQYFSSTPNKACTGSNETRLLAYADWSGLRPMSILEFNKASYGPLQPTSSGLNFYPVAGLASSFSNSAITNVGSLATSTSTRSSAGATYYGSLDFTGNAQEPVVSLNFLSFSPLNGNGILTINGLSDVSTWPVGTQANSILFVDQCNCNGGNGFRYVRSAE